MPMNPAGQEGAHRYSVRHFLIVLVIMLVVLPFVDELKSGDLIETVLITMVFLSAVMAVGGRRRTFIMACVLMAPAVIAKWIDHFQPDAIPAEFTPVAAIVFTSFLLVHLFAFILRAPWVNVEVLSAAIATFLMMGFLGTVAYELVDELVPQSFAFTVGSEEHHPITRFEAMYFSFGVLTTCYGDIMPVSRAARTLATGQSMAGLFYLAVLISRLVSLYSESKPTEATSDQHPSE